jgi:protein-disulfide isomerase
MNGSSESKDPKRSELVRNRIFVIILVSIGSILVVTAFVIPMMNSARNSVGISATSMPVTTIEPKVITARVDGQHLGDLTAPVKMDVWEDFQCPACKNYSMNIEPEVITNYVDTGMVFYTYHFYPLIDGGNATGESHRSAMAALCASDQGRFWDYHDILFANWNGENQGSFSDARLNEFAQKIGLNMSTFDQCFHANSYAKFITEDMDSGQTAGVHGTPSVLVNGRLITPGYVPTYDQISIAIDDALAGK